MHHARDILTGAITIAAGILLAVVVIAGGWALTRPDRLLAVNLVDYACAVAGTELQCRLK